MKPDWGESPDWANFVAMDSDLNLFGFVMRRIEIDVQECLGQLLDQSTLKSLETRIQMVVNHWGSVTKREQITSRLRFNVEVDESVPSRVNLIPANKYTMTMMEAYLERNP